MKKLIVQDFIDIIRNPEFEGFQKGTVVKLLDRLYIVVSNIVTGDSESGYNLTTIKNVPYDNFNLETSDGIKISNKKFITDLTSYLTSLGIKVELDKDLIYWRLIY